jgi:hypothetical protein
MRHLTIASVLAIALSGATATGASARNYTFSTFDVPGAVAGSTYAEGINNTGQVTGYYSDAGGSHGFVDTNGAFTTIDVPGASSTVA